MLLPEELEAPEEPEEPLPVGDALPELLGFPLLEMKGFPLDDSAAVVRSKSNWNIVSRSCMSR